MGKGYQLMRSDMSKVVIERPRWGHSEPSVKTGRKIRRYDENEEYEDLPKREKYSMNRHSGSFTGKAFSDFLAPLQRYMRSNFGRPWDKVYSEMRAHLDFRKTTGRHVFEHVQWEVELHCYLGADGKVYEQPRWGKPRLVEGLYVHPHTVLLCWKEPRNRRKERLVEAKAKPVTKVHTNGNRYYLKLHGIWYEAELEAANQTRAAAYNQRAIEIYAEDPRWQIAWKRQLSSKELRGAKLSNDTA
jgi:hypothetical protein